MKKIIPGIFCLFLLSRYTAAQAADPDYRGLMTVIKDYDQAWNRKDIAGVSKVLAEDYVYFTSNGRMTDRKATLEFLASADYKLTFSNRSEVVLHSIYGPTAVVGSRWKGRGTWKGKQITDDQRCGQVFVRAKGAWKLLSEHCVQIAPE